LWEAAASCVLDAFQLLARLSPLRKRILSSRLGSRLRCEYRPSYRLDLVKGKLPWKSCRCSATSNPHSGISATTMIKLNASICLIYKALRLDRKVVSSSSTWVNWSLRPLPDSAPHHHAASCLHQVPEKSPEGPEGGEQYCQLGSGTGTAPSE
jgi:hypothetical protein